jgi:spire-like protein
MPDLSDGGASEKDFLISLGRLLYSALDYGLSETVERVLDPDLENFIVKLTTQEDEGSCDEGIENDEDESAPPLLQPLTRTSVLQVSNLIFPSIEF